MDEAFCTGIRQTLAQICITTDPSLILPDDQLRTIDAFLQLLQHPDEQVQLDGAMGLTNLLTVGDEVRSLALQPGAWNLCQERLFSESQCDLELQVFTSFCAAPDHGTQVAATGALAMLARNPEVALRIASGARCQRLLEVYATAEDPDIQHRVVSCLTGLYQAPGLPSELHKLIRSALAEKLDNRGFASSEAEALASSVLEEEEEES